MNVKYDVRAMGAEPGNDMPGMKMPASDGDSRPFGRFIAGLVGGPPWVNLRGKGVIRTLATHARSGAMATKINHEDQCARDN